MNRDGERPIIRLLGALYTVDEQLETALEPQGLSLAKLGALFHLVEAGEALPLGTLAERLACVKSNITQLIDRLESEKLVARVQDPKDRRSVRAELTPEGRARYLAGASVLDEMEHRVFSRLSEAERAELFRMLGLISGE